MDPRQDPGLDHLDSDWWHTNPDADEVGRRKVRLDIASIYWMERGLLQNYSPSPRPSFSLYDETQNAAYEELMSVINALPNSV